MVKKKFTKLYATKKYKISQKENKNIETIKMAL